MAKLAENCSLARGEPGSQLGQSFWNLAAGTRQRSREGDGAARGSIAAAGRFRRLNEDVVTGAEGDGYRTECRDHMTRKPES